MEQINITAHIEKMLENEGVFNIDIAIDHFENYIDTTLNQINYLTKEREKMLHVVRTLKTCREIASLANEKMKKPKFEKV